MTEETNTNPTITAFRENVDAYQACQREFKRLDNDKDHDSARLQRAEEQREVACALMIESAKALDDDARSATAPTPTKAAYKVRDAYEALAADPSNEHLKRASDAMIQSESS